MPILVPSAFDPRTRLEYVITAEIVYWSNWSTAYKYKYTRGWASRIGESSCVWRHTSSRTTFYRRHSACRSTIDDSAVREKGRGREEGKKKKKKKKGSKKGRREKTIRRFVTIDHECWTAAQAASEFLVTVSRVLFRFFRRVFVFWGGGEGGGGVAAEFSDSSANFCEAFFFFVELGVNYAVLTILQHARSVWLGNVV